MPVTKVLLLIGRPFQQVVVDKTEAKREPVVQSKDVYPKGFEILSRTER